MRTKKTHLLIIGGLAFLLAAGPSTAAVQLGMHMDFVLSNGTSVRVFPAATDTSRDNLHPRWAPPPDLPDQPEDETCEELEQKYDERIGRAQEREEAAAEKPVAAAQRPTWLKSTPRLKAVFAIGGAVRTPKPSDWYYLPTVPKLSFSDERPEATFVKFITDEEEGPDAAAGGIFHMMVSYGLTPDEEAELRTVLEEAVPGARLRGMVELTPAGVGENFVVTSGTLQDQQFAPSGILTSGRAPTYPGAKAALAGRLSPIGAQLLASTFENPTSDLSVTFAYDYVAKTQAFTANVRINLDKVRKIAECSYDAQTVTRRKKRKWGWIIIPYYTESEEIDKVSREQYEHTYDVLRTTGAVTINIDQNLPDIEVAGIESTLIDKAMESFMDIQRSFSMPGADDIDTGGEEGEGEDDDRPAGENYTVLKISKKRESMSGQIAFSVTKSMAVYRSHVMTGNMGAVLRDYEDEVFSTVLLNDPFFRRGRVLVDLDADALDLFEAGMVNNVAVHVRPSYEGSNRQDKVFDRQTVAGGTVTEVFTFATGGQELSSRCPIKYSQSWSLRGGGKWPSSSSDECTREMNITLVPPIEARDIEVEADLSELEQVGIRAVDVLLRHSRYGKEEVETVKFRVARPEPYVETRLFVDKGETERTPVDFSLVFTHKEKGQLPQSPWVRLEGDFVYASVSGLPRNYIQELGGIVGEVRELIEGVQELTN